MQTNVTRDAIHRIPGDSRPSGDLRRVLIAYDGSAGAAEAIEDLARASLPEQLEALVVFVHDNTHPENVCRFSNAAQLDYFALARGSEFPGRRIAEAARSQLLTVFPRWRVEMEMNTDTPAGGILGAAAVWQPDLLVAGAHGHSGCEVLLLGSVARRIARTAWCPVRIARAPRRSPGRNVRIILAADGTFADEAIVQAVSTRDWPVRAEIQILTVVDKQLNELTAGQGSFTAAWKQQHGRSADTHACQVVDQLRNRLCSAGMSAETLIFEGDSARRVIAWEADCIFVGGASERGAAVPASNAAFRIAASAPCSVEIARAQKPCLP